MADIEQQEIDPSKVVQRRRRPPLSCTECRKRKVKCDRSFPCAQCVRSKTADMCVFVGLPDASESTKMSPPPSRSRLHASNKSESSGIFVFDSKLGPRNKYNRVSKSNPSDELHELQNRLRALEKTLQKSNSSFTPDNSVYEGSSEITSSTEAVGVDDRVRHLPDVSFRGKKGKTHYFGRSHYTTTVSFFQDIGSFLRRVGREKYKDKDILDIKSFKRENQIRESREHQVAFQEHAFKLHELVPPRKVADQLLQLYLDSFETTYRILHIPTFLKEYNDYWANNQQPDSAFEAQLLAVMAAGSCFYIPVPEDEERETYRKPAMRWIMAVQVELSCTFVTPRIDFKMLQTYCLLLVARLATGNDIDVAWASSGSLIRIAMGMGLHRDPKRFRKKATPFWFEMRRRLWATIVELDLNISLDRGFLPYTDLNECDCDAPSNWDDSELFEHLEGNPDPVSTATYTSNFYQNLLTRTLALRHHIAKRINSLKFNLSYDEALQISEELLQHIQHAKSLFDDNEFGFNNAHMAKDLFAQSFYLHIMRKTLLALHRPFSLSVVRLPKCSYSRKICLETSLEMLSQMELPSPSDQILCPYITQLGNGMFRDEAFHAAMTVCVELSLQAHEMGNSTDFSLEGINSSVLVSMVQSQQAVMLQAVERILDDFGRRIDSGGSGCKPYFFLSIILSSVQSRIKGEDPLAKVEAASRRAVMICRGIVSGLSYYDAVKYADRGPVQVCFHGPLYHQHANIRKVPNITQLTPISGEPVSSEFDTSYMLSTDFDLTLDFEGWFDSLNTSGTETWDNDFFNNMPIQ
ncbi:transcriptional regulator family: Fungal Specific TF [Penicillium taxi]|uniref:transcriptional regulator family: Fungal Specific TF n=1 Tax=Penicillium taxi TaxID=168475 RepID=UPI00254572E6|nr:transcriptional regulator family: Fungal Specific TF [Penicillium taxi]KAJ5909207.1 transcriptional regulator family: Fungal Specific TF [Penicillium taxi]